MLKRKRCDAVERDGPLAAKRIRTGGKCNLRDLSDEILLRVLAYLPIKDLLRTEQYDILTFYGARS